NEGLIPDAVLFVVPASNTRDLDDLDLVGVTKTKPVLEFPGNAENLESGGTSETIRVDDVDAVTDLNAWIAWNRNSIRDRSRPSVALQNVPEHHPGLELVLKPPVTAQLDNTLAVPLDALAVGSDRLTPLGCFTGHVVRGVSPGAFGVLGNQGSCNTEPTESLAVFELGVASRRPTVTNLDLGPVSVSFPNLDIQVKVQIGVGVGVERLVVELRRVVVPRHALSRPEHIRVRAHDIFRILQPERVPNIISWHHEVCQIDVVSVPHERLVHAGIVVHDLELRPTRPSGHLPEVPDRVHRQTQIKT